MSDNLATRYPVSVKAVVQLNEKFVLLKNERDEWELPGGKLDPGEDIESCVVREIGEELNIKCVVRRPLNNWVYKVNGVDVVIITYHVESSETAGDVAVSAEHKEVGFFSLQDALFLNMPDGYKSSLKLALLSVLDNGLTC